LFYVLYSLIHSIIYILLALPSFFLWCTLSSDTLLPHLHRSLSPIPHLLPQLFLTFLHSWSPPPFNLSPFVWAGVSWCLLVSTLSSLWRWLLAPPPLTRALPTQNLSYYNTIHYIVLPYSTIQYYTLYCITILYHTILYTLSYNNTVPYNTILYCIIILYHAILYTLLYYNTVPYNTIHYIVL